MKEGDPATLRPGAHAGWNRFHPDLGGALESRVQIVDSNADVMHAGTSPLQVPGHCRGRIGRLEELDTASPGTEEGDPYPLAGNFLHGAGVSPEEPGPERHGLGEGIDRDSDVVDLAHPALRIVRPGARRPLRTTPGET
jgi:hypothetical protein